LLSRNFSDAAGCSGSAVGDRRLGTILLVDCPGGGGSPGCGEGSVSPGPAPIVCRGLDHVHRIGSGGAVFGGAAGFVGCFWRVVWLSYAGGRAGLAVRTRPGVCGVYEKDETAHTIPHLGSASCRAV